jgi:GntR family transcriptional regulator
MGTGPTEARPLQVRIADDLRAKIETGFYVPGAKLPTYDELATEYMCTLGPPRKAIDLLQQQGLVVTHQGKGIFVRESPKARRVGRDRYRRSVWLTGGRKLLDAEAADQGLRVDPQMMRFIGMVPAPKEAAERLRIEPGTLVHARKRTTVIEGRPNQLADSYYPADVADAAPMLDEDETGPGGGFARLEEAGYHLTEIEEEISVRMPTSPESVSLHLPAGTPVVDLYRTTYDSTGRPVEVMLAVIAGDMAVFGDRFPIPD